MLTLCKSVCILIKKHQIIRILLIHMIICLKKFPLDYGHQHHQLVKLDKCFFLNVKKLTDVSS